MNDINHDSEECQEGPLDPNLVNLILALSETEAKLRGHLPFDEYLHTLLEKASIEKKVEDYSEEKRGAAMKESRRYRPAS